MKKRKSMGLSIAALAERAQVDRGNLSRIERGQSKVSLDGATRLAAVLGLSEIEVLYPERFIEQEPT